MSLFLEDFPPVSTQAWEETVRKDLNGADYAKKLVWQSEDSLRIKPYYRSEDVSGLSHLDSAPGHFPYLRGVREGGEWRIREEIDGADARSANQAAISAINAGAEEIEFCHAQPRNRSDLALLCAGLDQIAIHFHNASEDLVRLLLELPSTQRWSTSLSALDHTELAAEIAPREPTTRAFTVDAARFEESGATTVQEVGFTLAEGIDYLTAVEAFNIPPDRSAGLICFSFAMGSNYFFQIAKLRAFRLLWARVVESFGGSRDAAKARIHARSSRWNKTIYDPHVNILRGTTEAISAILGGADSLSISSFDSCYKAPDEASRRLARNTQIILKQEAHLARVADPGAGAYYVEVLTDSIARESWKIMQSIEAGGGFRQAGEFVSRTLSASLAAREKAVAQRRQVLVGTNNYPNPSERALDRIDPGRTNVIHRGAEVFEKIRLRTERHAKRTGRCPRILLAEMGDPKMRLARSTFAYNFFGCAGFDVVQRRFDTDFVEVFDADLIVLCSSDPEYPALASWLISQLRKGSREIPVVIAGNPDLAEQLKQLGVADFVHVRSNPVETLEKWQERLGMKG